MRLLYIVLAGLILTRCTNQERIPSSFPGEEADKVLPAGNKQEMITITAVGDMMLGSDYPQKSRFPKHNILSTLADSLKTGHFLLGNLEGVITNVPNPEKKCINPGSCYVFRMPPGTENLFKKAGFDFLSLGARLSRSFAITERLRLEAIAEGFNLTNHVNGVSLNGTFGTGMYPGSPSPSFGQLTAVGYPRGFQFSLRMSF